jgi:choline dehydrogenase
VLEVVFLLKKFFLLSCFLSITSIAAELESIEALCADYVVVGMGAAGAEIASRLSQAGFSVIALEAGGNHDNDEPIKNSTFAPVLEEDYFPQYFYQLLQVLQSNADDAQFNYTTGRLLGGGTSINGEQYVEGTDQVYAQWENLLGDFWSISKIREAFLRIEKYNGFTTCNRGHNGKLDIRQAPVVATSMATKFVQAVSAATGFAEILDYNCSQSENGPFTRWQLTQKPNGNRESSSTAFLRPMLESSQPNLQILDNSTVLKILIDEDNQASGVSILKNGKPCTVCAQKKVIISAGVNSSYLLQLSGIGPRAVLEQAHVKVRVDSPNVGQNLINHLTNVALFSANPNDVGVPALDLSALYVGGAFLPDPSQPIVTNPAQLRGVQLIGSSPEPGVFAIGIIALQPKSRGSANIQNGDPLRIPLVNDNAFSDPADLQTFKDIFRVYIKNIAQQLNLIDPLYNLVAPPLAVINDDALLEEYILKNLDHTHHWTGTCKMGTSRANGVTDKFGNVFGVRNLVVADASTAPFIPDGNTQAVAYLIGDRVAEHIIAACTN